MKKLFYIFPLMSVLLMTFGCQEWGTEVPTYAKWDGRIATDYAGGKGTEKNPYIIQTGGQLLYALKEGSGHLRLVSDIDLNHHNWKSFDFSGTLDGAGHTISNLTIDRSDEDYCGLIRRLSSRSSSTGIVKNLTICGVNIMGSQNVGTIAGEADQNSSISDCRVVLTSGSRVYGSGNYVGGIVGATSTPIAHCSVISTNDSVYITGADNVGGIVGHTLNSSSSIKDCHASCNISGKDELGGIVGKFYGNNNIEECSFQGAIYGKENLGGIVGNIGNYTNIVACKAEVHIEGDEIIGGICGDAYHGEIIACYSDGSISSQVDYNAGGITGHGGYNFVIRLCYSTMSHGIDGYSAKLEDCCTVYNSRNIAERFSDAYSDYASYWNFDNTWTWIGTVDDTERSVECPRLAWEENENLLN